MTKYLITIIATSIFVALSEMVLPNGKLKVVVNTVFSIIVLFTVINSISSINNEDFDFVLNFEDQEIKDVNLNYITDHFDNTIKTYYQNLYVEKLKNNDLIAEKINVEICNLEIIKVEVFLSNLVIPSKNTHINNNVIKSYVANVLEIAENKVNVYV